MSEFSEQLLSERRNKTSRFRITVLALVPLAAILFQVWVPRFFASTQYLELPLLVTVYFSLMMRNQIAGVFIGSAIGLVQDSLSDQHLGMFGIVKTLVGYFAASVSLRFDVDHAMIRFVMGFFFYLFHQFFYWVLQRALLGRAIDFDIQQNLVHGLLNAVVAIPLFHLLDRLKSTRLPRF